MYPEISKECFDSFYSHKKSIACNCGFYLMEVGIAMQNGIECKPHTRPCVMNTCMMKPCVIRCESVSEIMQQQ